VIVIVALVIGTIRAALRANLRFAIRQFNKHILNPFMLRVMEHRKTYYGVVAHVGRHSGKPYATPVVAKLTSEGVVVPLPYGAETDWCRNVLAAGGCTLMLNGAEYRLNSPQVVSSEIAEPLVPQANAWLWRHVGVKEYLLLRTEPGQQGEALLEPSSAPFDAEDGIALCDRLEFSHWSGR
jgi:hypothetical protein